MKPHHILFKLNVMVLTFDERPLSSIALTFRFCWFFSVYDKCNMRVMQTWREKTMKVHVFAQTCVTKSRNFNVPSRSWHSFPQIVIHRLLIHRLLIINLTLMTRSGSQFKMNIKRLFPKNRSDLKFFLRCADPCFHDEFILVCYTQLHLVRLFCDILLPYSAPE